MFDEVDQRKKKLKKKGWKSTMMGEEWNKLDHGWRMEDGGWRMEKGNNMCHAFGMEKTSPAVKY